MQTQDGPVASAITEHFDQLGVGATVGIGMEIRGMLPVPVLLEARYYLGLKDGLSGSELYYAGSRLRVRPRTFMFSVGFSF